jgi:DNA-binding CsgD family transcriptional regulator
VPQAPPLGRSLERASLDGMLERIRAGGSETRVLVGDAGLGKSVLLEYACDAARDLRVLRVAGVESERELSYSALHQLTMSLADRVSDLPEPQCDALRAAFGQISTAVPTPFVLGLAALTLLSRAAADRPMLCVIDDAQWLDRESLLVLTFVARRLQADGVGMVFALRSGDDVESSFEHLPTLHLRGLTNEDTGQVIGHKDELTAGGEVLTAAGQGLEVLTRPTIAAVVEDATERRHGCIPADADHALAVLELGLGHYDDAFRHATQASNENHILVNGVLLPDLVEAAVRAGHADAAIQARERFAVIARTSQEDFPLGMLARSQALTAADGAAEELYREAIRRLKMCAAHGQLARAHLVFGEWLRRQNRRRDARDELREALRLFELIRFEAFAERCRRELAATGERVRKRTGDEPDALTPQETEVARLAARGATNREIASQLFISAATVDYHLRKVFRKLGIDSRRALSRVVGTDHR